jgi:hypothetical protein
MMIRQEEVKPSHRQEFWKQQLEAFSQSELSVQAFCRERNLGCASFYHWKRKIGGVAVAPRRRRSNSKLSNVIAIPVLPPETLRPRQQEQSLKITIAGIALEFSSHVPAVVVADVLLAVHSQQRVRSC